MVSKDPGESPKKNDQPDDDTAADTDPSTVASQPADTCDDAAVLLTHPLVETGRPQRPTSLEAQFSEGHHRHKTFTSNGFDRLEIQKPKLCGKLSDSAIECARQKEKTPLREKLSDSAVHNYRRSRNSSSGEERDEISSLIGEGSINKSSDSVFDDGLAIERSPRRSHRRKMSEGSHSYRNSPRSSEFRRSRRSMRGSSSGDHSRKPSTRRHSNATPSHTSRKMSAVGGERKDSSPQHFNAQQLDYLRRKSKKFHGPYMSPGLNIAHSYRNPGAEILMAVLIILVGLVTLIVSFATGTKVWLIVGCVCCSLGGMFMILGLCWYCATPQGKDPAYSVEIKGITKRGLSHRESTRSRASHDDDDDEDKHDHLLEKRERRSTSASPIPV